MRASIDLASADVASTAPAWDPPVPGEIRRSSTPRDRRSQPQAPGPPRAHQLGSHGAQPSSAAVRTL